MDLQLHDAHPPGFTDAGYIINNNEIHVLTCGKDGKVIVRSHELLGQEPTKVISAAKATTVQEPQLDQEFPLNRLVASPNGDRFAIADDNRFVKVIFSPFVLSLCRCHHLKRSCRGWPCRLPSS